MANIREVVPSVRCVNHLARVSHCSIMKAVVIGDVVHVSLIDRHMVILNSIKAVSDLLEHRSTVYSSRPQSIMAHGLCVL